jgi:hypothetical protein
METKHTNDEAEEVGIKFQDFFNFLRRKDIAIKKFIKEKEIYDGTRASTQKRNAGGKTRNKGGCYQRSGNKD